LAGPGAGEDQSEVYALLRRAEELRGDYRRVYMYFVKHLSVGDLRAVEDLERMGIENPQAIIEELVELGILERGLDCYNLVRPLHRYFARKRRLL